MAFNMNRPVIKGTPLHKASVAKAKAKSTSIVSQSRTTMDAGLVDAANALGKSNVPEAQSYKLKSYDFETNIPEKKEGGKELTDGQKATAAEKLRKKNLKKEYDKEHSGGTLFPNGKYYDADGNEVKQKGKKTPTDNMFNDVDADGNVVSRLFGRAKEAAKEKLKLKTAKETEQARINAENQAKIDAEKLKKDEHRAKVKELKGYQKEKDAADKEAQRLKDIQMNKKAVIEVGEVTTQGIGDQQIQQYTKEQKDRLKKEGVFSEDAGKMVLPEEIVNGQFVSKADGTKLEIITHNADGTLAPKDEEQNKVTEGATTRTRKQLENDKIYNDFRTSDYKKRKMIEQGYSPIQSKSPMEMRDDRIYRGANENGPVRKNMIQGGYTPE